MALHIFAAWKSITQGHRCDDCDDWSGGASTEAFVSAKRLKEHAARCPFTMVPCTNAKAGCTALVRRFQLNVHRLWECKHEAASCVHCGVKMPRLQLKSHLWPPLAVPCRYDCGHHFKSEKAERKHAASCWVQKRAGLNSALPLLASPLRSHTATSSLYRCSARCAPRTRRASSAAAASSRERRGGRWRR